MTSLLCSAAVWVRLVPWRCRHQPSVRITKCKKGGHLSICLPSYFGSYKGLSSPIPTIDEAPPEKLLAGSKRPRAEVCDGHQSKAPALGQPALIDFGSVGCMGLLGSASRFLKVLSSALSIAGLPAILLTGAALPLVQLRCSPLAIPASLLTSLCYLKKAKRQLCDVRLFIESP